VLEFPIPILNPGASIDPLFSLYVPGNAQLGEQCIKAGINACDGFNDIYGTGNFDHEHIEIIDGCP